jgi:hypothetical protein
MDHESNFDSNIWLTEIIIKKNSAIFCYLNTVKNIGTLPDRMNGFVFMSSLSINEEGISLIESKSPTVQ